MTQPDAKDFEQFKRGFRWEAFLPKRKAWMQTLILLPFGIHVANFLVNSWHFAVNSIVEERQYPIGILSMAISLLLPSVFFAFLFQWGGAIFKQESSTWYPHTRALWAGFYTTMTIAVSFGIVRLFTHTLSVCGNPAWGFVGENLLCNLDGYGFESKSWFGAWFIIAAYCYQVQGSIDSLYRQMFHPHSRSSRFSIVDEARPDLADFTSVVSAHGDLTVEDDFRSNPKIDPIANNSED
jgi:hypothetical protein